MAVLFLLDLSAAFDTVDHKILIDRLGNWVGLSNCVLAWFQSYLSDGQFFVSLGDHVSETHSTQHGIPQGSILGSILFSLYMLPLGIIINHHQVNYYFYADDAQLYISISPNDPTALHRLTACLSDINVWMSKNFLKLNEEKTEILLIGPIAAREKLHSMLGGFSGHIKTQVTNLGVIVDSDLNFHFHFNKVIKISFFHLRNIAKVRPFLTPKDTEMLIHAFITSRLDYCNSLFTGLPIKSTRKLQLVQNAAARVVTKTKKINHITPLLKTLHWLPVSFRIDFKVLLFVYKCIW